MKIGIVTVTYNSRSVLEDFLTSLSRQKYSNYFLYAVDSGSTDGTVVYLRDHAPRACTVMQNAENIGFASATNQGIRAALQDGCIAILAMNNDVVFGEELLDRLASGLDRYQCDMAAPMMYYHQPKNRIWAAGGNLNRWLGYRSSHRGKNEIDHGQYNIPCRITFAPLCCVLIRREVFDRIGLLDERYFTYAEDADFMYRAYRNRIRMCFVPDAMLWHKVSSLTGGDTSDFQIHYCTRNRIYFLKKNLSHLSAVFWCVVYRVYFRFRNLTGHDSRRISALKQLSVREGIELANRL